MENKIQAILALCLTMLFIVAGIRHLSSLKKSTEFLKKFTPFKFMPYFVNLSVIMISSLIELLAPLIIVFSILTNSYNSFKEYSINLLILFMVSTLLFIHNPFYKDQLNPFLNNLSITAGLYILKEGF